MIRVWSNLNLARVSPSLGSRIVQKKISTQKEYRTCFHQLKHGQDNSGGQDSHLADSVNRSPYSVSPSSLPSSFPRWLLHRIMTMRQFSLVGWRLIRDGWTWPWLVTLVVRALENTCPSPQTHPACHICPKVRNRWKGAINNQQYQKQFNRYFNIGNTSTAPSRTASVSARLASFSRSRHSCSLEWSWFRFLNFVVSPVFPMLCAVSEIESIWFQVARLLGTLCNKAYICVSPTISSWNLTLLLLPNLGLNSLSVSVSPARLPSRGWRRISTRSVQQHWQCCAVEETLVSKSSSTFSRFRPLIFSKNNLHCCFWSSSVRPSSLLSAIPASVLYDNYL